MYERLWKNTIYMQACNRERERERERARGGGNGEKAVTTSLWHHINDDTYQFNVLFIMLSHRDVSTTSTQCMHYVDVVTTP